MRSYRIEILVHVIDDQAEQLNAELLDETTRPALAGEITTRIDAESADDALIQALRWAAEQREARG